MSHPTYSELIQLLSEAERDQSDLQSVAELLAGRFCDLCPHIKISRPGRFLETAKACTHCPQLLPEATGQQPEAEMVYLADRESSYISATMNMVPAVLCLGFFFAAALANPLLTNGSYS